VHQELNAGAPGAKLEGARRLTQVCQELVPGVPETPLGGTKCSTQREPKP